MKKLLSQYIKERLDFCQKCYRPTEQALSEIMKYVEDKEIIVEGNQQDESDYSDMVAINTLKNIVGKKL